MKTLCIALCTKKNNNHKILPPKLPNPKPRQMGNGNSQTIVYQHNTTITQWKFLGNITRKIRLPQMGNPKILQLNYSVRVVGEEGVA